MKVLSILGSMRKEESTYKVMNYFVDSLKDSSNKIHNEIIYTSDIEILPCKVECASDCKNSDFKCSIDDDLDYVLNKMKDADLIVIAAPLYFRVPPAKFHTFAERLISMFINIEFEVSNNYISPLYDKPCVLMGVAEYSDPSTVLEYLNDFVNILKMKPVKLDKFPYLGIGGQGNIDEDRIFNPIENAINIAKKVINEQ